MNWKTLIALLLFPAMYVWCGIQIPLGGAVEFATHMAEEGQHCDDHCSHPVSLIDRPQVTDSVEAVWDLCLPQGQLLARRLHPHAARDRPPPLLCSTSHGLRAPPTLILA